MPGVEKLEVLLPLQVHLYDALNQNCGDMLLVLTTKLPYFLEKNVLPQTPLNDLCLFYHLNFDVAQKLCDLEFQNVLANHPLQFRLTLLLLQKLELFLSLMLSYFRLKSHNHGCHP
jgi:hypothetical protein